MKFKTILATATAVSIASSSHAAITISANNLGAGRQLTTQSGTLLAAGTGSLRIGYFLDSNSPVLRSGDWAAINAVFIPLGEGSSPNLGDVTTPAGVPGNSPIPVPSAATAGRVSGQITGVIGTNDAVAPPVSASTLVQGTRLFLLASNSPDPKVSAPAEFALVSDAVIWLAPKDDPTIPGGASLTMAMNVANLNEPADIYWGTIDTQGTSNFLRLAPPIPEPATSLLGLVGLGLLARRRR
jgi:MYXO-CTERM domain-containing protein